MSEKRCQNQPQKKAAAALTAEQQAAALADVFVRKAEAKAERERVELYGKSLQNRSDRQIRSELKRIIRKEHAGKPPQPQAGLTILYASVLLTVLENTKTRENPSGRLDAYPR
jgi:hypothetical protein